MQIEDSSTILKKIEIVKKDFMHNDWEQKYEKIIEYGKNWKGIEESVKNEDLKIKGCQSQVWIKAELTPDKKIKFYGDSDALIVKGLVAILLTVYSDETPEAILKTEPLFIKDIGFDSGLSPSRANGLYAMLKQIKYYATAFQYLLSK